MGEHTSGQPSWLETLDLLLSPSAEHGNALSPLHLLEEVDGWLKVARSRRQWMLNRRSLAGEVEATCKLFGSSLRKAVGPSLPAARRSIKDLIKVDAPTLAEQLPVLREFQDLRQELASDASVLAAWHDLLREAQSEGASFTRVEQLTFILASCLELRGVDCMSCFSELRRTFGASPAGPHHSMPISAGGHRANAEAALLEKAEEVLLSAPSPVHCAVWLQYEFARVNEFVLQTGDVTFFTANWALPNARMDDGQDFLFRDEMRFVLKDLDEWWTDKGPDEPQAFVIARVDLGVRMTRGAIRDGSEFVELLIAAATAQTGGIRWRRTGPAFIVADGKHIGMEWIATKPPSSENHYGMNITAETLSTSASELAVAMSSRTLPEEIREAIRLISEAGLERSYENAFGVTQNLHARSAIAQRNHAFEHVAAWGGFSARELELETTRYWAYSEWQSEMGIIIEGALRSAWNDTETHPLNAELHPGGYGGPLLLYVANDRQKELVALLRSPVERERLRWLMKGMRDPSHYLLVERAYRAEHALGLDRLRRVRNALVHGNPVTPSVVQSVADLAIRKSNHALNLAVEAFNTGVPLDELLAAQRIDFDANQASLNAGRSWLEIWSAGRK